MPYIQEVREELVAVKAALAGVKAMSPGELNWLLSTVLARHLALNGRKYASLASGVAGLECAKLELQRRVISPYEQQKLFEAERASPHGDPYAV